MCTLFVCHQYEGSEKSKLYCKKLVLFFKYSKSLPGFVAKIIQPFNKVSFRDLLES